MLSNSKYVYNLAIIIQVARAKIDHFLLISLNFDEKSHNLSML